MRTKILAILVLAAFIALALWVNYRGAAAKDFIGLAMIVTPVFVVWMPLWWLELSSSSRVGLSLLITPFLFFFIAHIFSDGRNPLIGVAYFFGFFYTIFYVILFEFFAILISSKKKKPRKKASNIPPKADDSANETTRQIPNG